MIFVSYLIYIYIYVNILIQEESDCPDLEYNYGDTDTHLCEMAELYSYSELEDYQTNIQVIIIFYNYLFCYINIIKTSNVNIEILSDNNECCYEINVTNSHFIIIVVLRQNTNTYRL